MKFKAHFKFSPLILDAIFSNEELFNWFKKNQEMMAYYEFTHSGCKQFENSSESNFIRVLGRMATAFFTNLENDQLEYNERVKLTVEALKQIYNEEKDNLNDIEKEFLSVSSTEEDSKEQTIRKLTK